MLSVLSKKYVYIYIYQSLYVKLELYLPDIKVQNISFDIREITANKQIGLISAMSSCQICSVSQKNLPWGFVALFPKRLGIFRPNFTSLLCVPIYARRQIFIQLSATLTKLCHIKRNHHNMLKMSTIDRNARWVVALNMAWLCHSWR